jgi:hypothetical protein
VGGDENTDYSGRTYETGRQVVNFTATIADAYKDKYEITEVYSHDYDSYEEGYGYKNRISERSSDQYTLTFNQTESGLVDVYVSIDEKGLAEGDTRTIIFENKSKNLKVRYAYSLNSGSYDESTGKYTLSKGDNKVSFEVIAPQDYSPVIKINGVKQSLQNMSECDENGFFPDYDEDGNYTGTYDYRDYWFSYPASKFKDGDKVVIEEGEALYSLTLEYTSSEVSVSVNVDGAEYLSTEEVAERFEVWEYDEYDNGDDYGEAEVYVPKGNCTIVVHPKDNCSFEYAMTYKYGDEQYKDATNVKGTQVTVNVPTIDCVYIGSYSNCKTTLSVKGGDQVSYDKNSSAYLVEAGSAYTLRIRKGASTEVQFTYIDIYYYGTDKKYTNLAETKATIDSTDKTLAELTIDPGDAGRRLRVVVYNHGKVWDEETESYKESDRHFLTYFDLKVPETVKKITKIGTVNLDSNGIGALSQTIDSKVEYSITTSPANAGIGGLTAEVTGLNGASSTSTEKEAAQKLVSAEMTDGKLVITTQPATATEAAAKILLRDCADNDTVKATLTVTTTAPAWVNTAPTVKVTGSDTQSIDLALTLPKNTTAPNTGSLWYKVSYKKSSETDYTSAEYFRSTGDTTTAKVTVNPGATKKETYTVKVQLLLAKDKDTTIDKDKDIDTYILCRGTETKETAAATKDPYYETKLSLKKGATNIYTGQTDVVAATANYSKQTTYTSLATVQITDNSTGEKSAAAESATINGVTATIDGGSIKVSANNYYQVPSGEDSGTYQKAKPGKYTLTVAAAADENMQPATATLTITVVQGIEKIELQAADRICRKGSKAVTQKITTVLNNGEKDYTPKSKKVTYSLVGAGSQAAGKDKKVPESIESYVKVNANNGTITVDKNFVTSSAVANNQFAVKAEAKDYDGNITVAYSDDITITADPLNLGGVYIVQSADETTYKVIAGSNGKVTPAQLDEDESGNHTKVIVLDGVSLGADELTIKKDDSRILTETGSLTYASSSKLLTISSDGEITVNDHKAANNIKITVAVNDGSGVKAFLEKLTIDYADTTSTTYGLKVTNYYDTDEVYTTSDNSAKDVNTSGATALRLQVMVKDTTDSQWKESYQDLYNTKLTVKDASVLQKNDTTGEYVILPNKSKVTVTLSYGKNGTKTFELTNGSYKDPKDNTAPKLTASGSLLANYTAQSQTITYEITGDTAEAYKTDAAVARIEMDAKSLTGNAKLVKQYSDLADALGLYYGRSTEVDVSRTGKFSLTFNADADYRTAIPAGSYKLSITLGKKQGDKFVPTTATQSVTLKASNPAKVSYKAVTSVKMSMIDQASVVLKGSGKNYVSEAYTAIHDANNAGSSSGFTTYFTLDSATNTLSLNKGNFEAFQELTDKEKKAAGTGYVDYKYVGVDGKTYTGTAKLTVTVSDGKPVNTYKASAVTIVPQDKAELKTANVTITAGKSAADLADAVVATSNTPFKVASVNGGTVVLQYTGDVKAGEKYELKLAVLPKDSYSYAEWSQKAPADQADFVTKNGIEVAVKITVNVAANQSGKISVAKADLNQTFQNDQYKPATDSYYVDVPYTVLIPYDIEEASTADKENGKKYNITSSDNELVSFDADTTEQYITIALNKTKFEEAVKDEKQKNINYGKKITVKATVNFTGSKAETFSFSLTLPRKCSVDSDYATLLKSITDENTKGTFAKAVEVSYDKGWSDLENDGTPKAAELNASFEATTENWNAHTFDSSVYAAIQALNKEIRDNYAPVDTGVVIEYPQITWDDNTVSFHLESGDFQKPTSTEAGSLTIKANISNGKPGTDKTATTVQFTLTIPATDESQPTVE